MALTAWQASRTLLSERSASVKTEKGCGAKGQTRQSPALVVIATIARGGALSDSSLKGFFHQSDARLTPPVTDGSRILSGVFYGYPADLVAEICGVSVETAARWKSGDSSPSRPALRLFNLHRARKVLASPAWDGWLVNGDELVSPEGNSTTQGQLRAYYLVYQLAAELTRDRPEYRQRIDDILRSVG